MNEQEKMIQMIAQYRNSGGNMGNVDDFEHYVNAMGADGTTPFLGLNRWKRSDKPVMDDFNADNEKIDDAVRELWEKKANVGQQPEIYTLELADGIKPYLNRPPIYYKMFGIVTVMANLVSDDEIVKGSALASLPEGFRPKADFEYPVSTYWPATGTGTIAVTSTGTIIIGNGAYNKGILFHISFPSAQ